MPITLNDWLHSPIRQNTVQAIEAERATRQAQAMKVGENARLALNHPGWELFARHVEALLQDATAKVEAAKSRLVSEALPALEAEVLRLAALRWVGRMETLKEVLEYLPQVAAEGDRLDTSIHKPDTLTPMT